MEKAKAVYLEWIDSAGMAEWQTQDEVDDLTPYMVRTVGLLVKEDEACLVVAVAETVDDGECHFQKCYNGLMSIPACAVMTRYNIDLTIRDEDEVEEQPIAEGDAICPTCNFYIHGGARYMQ